MAPTTRQPFSAHIEELRSRLIWVVFVLVAGTVLGYVLRDQLLALLVAPLGQTLYYTSPGGGFSLIIQVCLGFGLVATIPVLIFHLLRFLAPILPTYSLKFLGIVLGCSCGLVALGVWFAYAISLPAALYFLNEFSTEQVQALISTDTYLSFVAIYLAGFALLFQLPLLLLVINQITPLKPKWLLIQTRWVVLGSVIVAAVITPTPDPFNQLIMATPVVGLYGLSIGVVGLVNRTAIPGKVEVTMQETLVDLSNKKLVSKTAGLHNGRNGYLCRWEETGRRATPLVTFLHEGEHEVIEAEGHSFMPHLLLEES